MSPSGDTIRGRCLCGAVSVTVPAEEPEIDICHCKMCARWGGAFYAGLEAGDWTIDGEDAVSIYASSEWAERAFCSRCGSNLWYEFKPTGNRTFLAGLFDLPVGVRIKH